MSGKRSQPQAWWARQSTLVSLGATALVVWLVAATWMLFAPSGSSDDGLDPRTTTTTTLPTVPGSSGAAESYDPGIYTGPVNTPTFTPRPKPGTTGGTAAPSPTQPSTLPTVWPSPKPTWPAPSPTSTPGHGHGHTKPPKP